jgi:glycosyltransferase involved in cell wall biosynthesis
MLLEKVSEAAFVTAISTYNKRMIVSVCDGQFEEKIEVIHCGIDTNVFFPRSEPTLCDRGEGPFQILCIGTLHEVKGQTYLVDACRLLKERGIDFRCHFAGDGPDMAALTKQVNQAGLQEHVKFHGRLTRSGIAKLLGGADVVVTPSVPSSDGRREGIPVVLMEAMGCALPVIASDLSGIPELVEDGKSGLLITPGDVDGLAAGLERLYYDPQLRHCLGKAGREKVLLEFDLHKNAGLLAQSFHRKAG